MYCQLLRLSMKFYCPHPQTYKHMNKKIFWNFLMKKVILNIVYFFFFQSCINYISLKFSNSCSSGSPHNRNTDTFNRKKEINQKKNSSHNA